LKVWGPGFRVSGLGSRVLDVGLSVPLLGCIQCWLAAAVSGRRGVGCGVQGAGYKVEDVGFIVYGLGSGIWG
jgi:hypothetical protein